MPVGLFTGLLQKLPVGVVFASLRVAVSHYPPRTTFCKSTSTVVTYFDQFVANSSSTMFSVENRSRLNIVDILPR